MMNRQQAIKLWELATYCEPVGCDENGDVSATKSNSFVDTVEFYKGSCMNIMYSYMALPRFAASWNSNNINYQKMLDGCNDVASFLREMADALEGKND
jgi:hypothetical protein